MRDAAGGTNYVCFYDANGNLGQLIDRSDGSVDAKYEYDAYGNNLLDASDPNESGLYADDNPIRFSTKYFDSELNYAETTNDGLYYFGYRYYTTRLGRWSSRDPAQELDGRNPYRFVHNQPTTMSDFAGLLTIRTLWKFDVFNRCMAESAFRLDKPAPCYGFLVQEVVVRIHVESCPCDGTSSVDQFIHFWEAWRVHPGEDRWEGEPMWGEPGARCTDIFDSGTFDGPGCYSVDAVGVVKFFCDSTTGHLWKLWPAGSIPEATWMPATRLRPAWWDTAPVEGPAMHSLFFAVTACCGPPPCYAHDCEVSP